MLTSSNTLKRLLLLSAAGVAILVIISQYVVSGVKSQEIRPRNEVLEELDKLISQGDIYVNRRLVKADSLKRVMNSIPDSHEKVELALELAKVQSGVSCDSAIMTLDRGMDLSLELNDSVMTQRFIIQRAHELFFSGQVTDALLEIDHVTAMGVRPENKEYFHSVARVLLYTIHTFGNYSSTESKVLDRAEYHARQQMECLPADTVTYDLVQSMIYLGQNDMPRMAETLHRAMLKSTPETPGYHIIAVLLGEYYKEVSRPEEAIYYYALAAMSQIKNADLFEVAVLRLGEYLYYLGDRDRAFKYLSFALEQAVESSAKFNLMRLSNAFLDVTRDQDAQLGTRMNLITGFALVLFVLLVLVGWLMIRKNREVKLLRETERRLARVNLAKNTYISEFMNLCASYMESLEEYNKLCRRKITAGQTDSLLNYIKSGSVLDEQRKKFYDVFDRAFLLLFSNYVEDVNAVLASDKQIVTPSSSVLNTELRIAALGRLGVDDPAMISRFLGISNNTVYTYRNKLRNRALDRNTFDDFMKHLGEV